MAPQAEPSASMFDTVKLVLVISLLIVGIAGFYYFASYALVYRVLGILAVFGLAVALVFTTAIGRKAWGFITESKMEVRKVIWPTRQETMQATMLVVAVVFSVGLILWLMDMVLFWAVGILTGQKV
ncbi:MAG: preprotein translocase subunit SecE [Candidatus Methylumidiphilus sp.]|nr:preprotein translocase subunit SecE [Pseudomonadota bacterium]